MSDGRRFEPDDRSKMGRKNLDVHLLDLQSKTWTHIEYRSGWRNFEISQKEWADFRRGEAEGFDPTWLTGFDTVSSMKHAHNSSRRVVFDGVVIALRREPSSCRVQIEGVLAPDRLEHLLAELVRQIEREVGVKCSVEEV